ncbi:MAG TPA: LLM class flavin-dependent oxidoreductase, partial [Capillimicrobium sp.]
MRPSPACPTAIGVALPRARGAALTRIAQRAESLGFDRLVAPGGAQGDALTVLSFAAAATERIGLATACLSLPGRRARLVGEAARSLDELSGGRFALWVTAAPERPPLEL